MMRMSEGCNTDLLESYRRAAVALVLCAIATDGMERAPNHEPALPEQLEAMSYSYCHAPRGVAEISRSESCHAGSFGATQVRALRQ